MQFQIVLAVALGGAVGAVGRFTISTLLQKVIGTNFPFGTLSVNILGSFIIGFYFYISNKIYLQYTKLY